MKHVKDPKCESNIFAYFIVKNAYAWGFKPMLLFVRTNPK